MSVRPDHFVTTINHLRGGEAQADLSEALEALCEACEETGKPGTLILEIKVKSNGRSGQFVITDKMTLKAPELAKGDTLLFTDEYGNLQREDPRKKKLELKHVPAPSMADLKNVG